MPDNVTKERTRILRMYQAQIVYSPGERGADGAVEMAQEMAAADPSFHRLHQYGNPANPRAHYNGTGLEILQDLGDVAAFVAGLGTGGTLMGTGRRLREELGPEVEIVAVEPMPGEGGRGLRSLDEGIIDLTLIDRRLPVSNGAAVAWTRRLLDEEGIFAGVSSGAIASAAVRIAGELSRVATSRSSSATTAGSTCRRGCTPDRSTRSSARTPGGELHGAHRQERDVVAQRAPPRRRARCA